MSWLSSDRAKKLGRHIHVPVIVTIYIIVGRLLDMTCPIYYFTGISCPACGMTRACLSLARLDIAGYIRYNAMALPTLFAICGLFLVQYIKSIHTKKLITSVSVIILIFDFIYYLYRYTAGLIP